MAIISFYAIISWLDKVWYLKTLLPSTGQPRQKNWRVSAVICGPTLDNLFMRCIEFFRTNLLCHNHYFFPINYHHLEKIISPTINFRFYDLLLSKLNFWLMLVDLNLHDKFYIYI